ncbi:Acyl-CoA synthetase (NDP forming) [Tistlia consotensis]|uniref:Acyl-CoA synthetase (NDP forming) n=1 Tax=Tistlia consotensis USBA 355 TaxID=560819 RepID=A0A1Y6BJL2_9PROT|nr:acetate--CoA ligase family protein [Tistlia consotensis]SMF13685.1 Acyl-CoA synthetase (NDP forming) [Tistlia consotensis USBA 355]SNR50287.1 Acyl-CoA synthetase (NDP forming) [Tistlia consotensis]
MPDDGTAPGQPATMPQGLLGRLLRPASIAVIGGKEAGVVIRQCEKMGYGGAIWPVNPTRSEVAGRPCFASVEDLPAAPDAAFVAVNRHRTLEVVEALAARGAGGAIAYASGFKEAGEEGGALQRRLVEASGLMPVIGPNCYGMINYLDGALLWPDQHGGRRCERGVAIVTQSGNIAINFTMNQRGLPIGYLLALGNQAKIGVAAAVEALIEDPRVTAVGLHLEGIDEPSRLARVAERARERGVPIVALKAGRSEAGKRLALSHTASLAGEDAVVDAFLRRLGIARVHSIPAFLETLKLLHVHGALPGRAIASMSCSGGEASLIADAGEQRRVAFRPLSAARREAVRATLSDLVAIDNPLDYHTFIWADRARTAATFGAMMDSGFDLTLLILDLPRADRCDPADWDVTLDALEDAVRATGRRAGVVATLGELMPEAVAERLIAAGIVPFEGIDEALAAIEAAADIGEAWALVGTGGLPPLLPFRPASEGAVRTLSEWDSKQALKAAGLALPPGRRVGSVEDAVATAEALGYPVVLKATGAGLAHKSELGAVRLKLEHAEAVRATAAELLPLGEALLVEAMVPDALAEVIVGVQHDPQLGLFLLVGSGGVLVELIADRAILMLMASAGEIERALRSLRVMRLIEGHRGRPAGDLPALVAAIQAVQRYAVSEAHRLVELDVNPILVRPLGAEGGGAVAVDALIRLREE